MPRSPALLRKQDKLAALYRDYLARSKIAIEDEARRKWVEHLRASVPDENSALAAIHRQALAQAEKALRVKRNPAKERRANTLRGRKRRAAMRAKREATAA